MKKFLIIIFTLLSFNSLAADKEVVKKFIDDLGNDIINIANNPKLSEENKKTKIISEIDKAVDSSWLAKFVLGKNYKMATEPQKTRFLDLYRQFMINTYGPKFKNYNGKEFKVVSVDMQGSFYVVKCLFVPKDTPSINVDFRVKEKDSKPYVLDFVAEGVSLIETQRSEFNSAISQKGFDQFLNELEVKTNNLKKK